MTPPEYREALTMSSSTTQTPDGGVKVEIHNDSNARLYEILGTLLLCGALGMLAFALAKNGWLEIGATMLTMFLIQLGRMLLQNGLINLPVAGQVQSEFTGTAGFIRTAVGEFRAWQAKSPMWRLAALAMGYTLLFMLGRWLVSVGLTVFTNMWIAGAAAALLASIIIAPSLLGSMAATMRSKVLK